MAAIARFGFENGLVPSNVSIVMSNATASAFVYGAGRNNGTCLEASNVASWGGSNGESIQNTTAQLSINMLQSNSVYFSCYLKLTDENYQQSFAIFSFGSISVFYNRTAKTFTFYVNGSLVYTSPATVIFPIGVWIPVSGRFIIGTSGDITINYDGTVYSMTPINTGNVPVSTFYINLGSGNMTSYSHVYSNGQYGPPKFRIDDVAINDGYSATNSTGSFGTGNTVIPPFVSCQIVKYSGTGSNTLGWTCPSGDLVSAISSSNSYITASFLPRPLLELYPSNSYSGVSTVEGINYYVQNAFREGSATAYIIPHFKLSDTSSVQGQYTIQLNTLPVSGTLSVFEKDLGGKISYDEFLAGKFAIGATQWMGKNFFGRGTLGDVRYTGSINVGDNSSEYTILEYKNLVIDAGATVGVSTSKKGLIIYVKENCIINGTLSMAGSAWTGSNLSTGFVFSKNKDLTEFSETGSLLNPAFTLATEQAFQPYQTTPITSSRFDIYPVYSGVAASADLSLYKCCGGGGNGAGGSGASSSTFGGGSGGGASYNFSYMPGGVGGGVIYLIVGKTLYISSTGIVSARGGDGYDIGYNGNSSGGGGGGSVVVLYGQNYINNGTIAVGGGLRSAGTGAASASGGSGSYRISKILP